MTADANELLARGRLHLDRAEIAEAVSVLEQAALASPDDTSVMKDLALAYLRCDQYLPALRMLDRIIDLGRADATIWLATGNALLDLSEHAQALGAFEHSLRLDDSSAETHHNLARACYQLGEVSRACDHLCRAIELSDSINSWQSLATLLPAWPEADQRTLIEKRKTFARKLADQTRTPWPDKSERPPAHRHDGPLRIGYLCAFFHNANYTKPVWAVINNHDRERFQISLFSDSPIEEGFSCYRPSQGDRVYDVRSLDNRQLAQVIRDAEVDILVELNAYSYEPRLSLFLQYPAPVVVAWWAMYASSGLPCIDYLVGDDEMIRPEEVEHFSETVLRLPLSYLTFTVDYPVPPVSDPPSTRSDRFTFGSLVTQYKMTPAVIDTWCTIMQGVPNSQIVLASRALKSAQNQNYLRGKFAERGIDSDRLILRGPADHDTYLRNYDDIDLALDAFPYNGGTTTMEAIWQGVPVLTFDGDRWISRTSQTLLRRCHLGEFVGDSVEEMIEIGIRWGTSGDSPKRLSKIRAQMRDRLAASSACDAKRLAAGMEELYQGVWNRHVGAVTTD